MGLDVRVETKEFYLWQYLDEQGKSSEESESLEHSFHLSRNFCVLLSFDGMIHPAFYRLEAFTGLDLSPIEDMLSYSDKEELDEYLEFAYENEDERQQLRNDADQARENLEGNLGKVLQTVIELIESLTKIGDFAESILKPGSWFNKTYFEVSKEDIEAQNIINNFGQDLRNFKRYLEFLKSLGKDTVWFSFG